MPTPSTAAKATKPAPEPIAAAAPPARDRAALLKALASAPELKNYEEGFMHGRAYAGPRMSPQTTWECNKPPRKDHSAPAWLTASEFADAPEVMEAKCATLANLLLVSQKTVLYTGAGISASVIGQAALSGTNKVGWANNTRAAPPTPTHHALARLGAMGLVHGWVQQNHDGLPQKAGFPQERICEVHGSWFDPSNPVVKYSGSLKTLEYEWMENEAETADLVIVIGTSLGGLCADMVANDTAQRSFKGGALGTVIINLQQTPCDGAATLRCFGKSDAVLRRVLQLLGSKEKLPTAPASWRHVEDLVLVPYDARGERAAEGAERMYLDLRAGANVRLHKAHNCVGARQPNSMHIGAKATLKLKDGREIKPGKGEGRVVGREDDSSSFTLAIDGASMRMGVWWLDAAARGALPCLPVVNVKPAYESSPPPNADAAASRRAAAARPAAAASAAAAKPKTRPTTKGSAMKEANKGVANVSDLYKGLE